MSYFSVVIDKIKGRVLTIKCPICHETSKQLATKVSKNAMLICPHCRAMFILDNK